MTDKDSKILIERYLSESMTENDVDDWIDHCRTDPELPERLFEHFLIDELLRDLSRGGLTESKLAKTVAEKIEFRDRPWCLRHPVLATSLLLLMLLVPVMIYQALPERVAPLPERIAVLREPEPIALLVDLVDPVWNRKEAGRQLGPLYEETFSIQSGLAKIQFECGAQVLLEGPAELKLLAKDRAECKRGQLSAVVPPQASGFRIDLPETSVIDLGTVFVVKVDEQGSEVQVQKGRIAMTEPTLDNAVLNTGQAVRCSNDVAWRYYHADMSLLKPIEAMAAAQGEELEALYRNDHSKKRRYPKVLLPDCTLIAQRGNMPDHVENTISSFRAAAASGVDACELDVTTAKDGTYIVIHPDRSAMQVPDGRPVPFFRLMPETIKQLNARTRQPDPEGERIPTLVETLNFFREETNCYVVIDVQEAGLVTGLVKILDNSGILDRLIVTAKHKETVDALKRLRPNLCIGLCCEMRMFPNSDDRLAERIIETANAVSADFIRLELKITTPDLITRCRNSGIPVWCYTINDPELMKTFLESGAVGIQTRKPEMLLGVPF